MIPIYLDSQKGMEAATGADLVAIDTETSGLRTRLDRVVGISLAVEGSAFYLPLRHVGVGSRNLDPASFRDAWLRIFRPHGPTVVMHNASFDLNMLAHEGFPIESPVVDTMLASHFLDENRSAKGKSYKLKELSLDLLHFRQPTYQEVAGEGSIGVVPIEKVALYAGADAYATLELWKKIRGQLSAQGLLDTFLRLEAGLIPVTARMIANGIGLDVDYLRKFEATLQVELDALSREIDAMAGHRVRLGSSDDLCRLLYRELKLPVQVRGKTNYPTADKHALDKLVKQDIHPIVEQIQKARERYQVISRVCQALPRHVNPRTGRIHPNIQRMTDTGRFYCSNPNLQGLPDRKGVRRAIVPAQGNVLVVGDLSQIELRVMAQYSRDATFLKAFQEGLDLHLETAKKVFPIPAGATKATHKKERDDAKTLNFAMIYGAGPGRISQALGVPRKEAERIIQAFFDGYPGVRSFIEETHSRIGETGEIVNVFGRRRRIPGIFEMAKLGRLSLDYQAHGRTGRFTGNVADLYEFCVSVELVEAFDAPLGRLVLRRSPEGVEIDRESPFMLDAGKKAQLPRKNFSYSHIRDVVIDGEDIRLMPLNEARRVGLNALIQSTASDINKLAMLRMDPITRRFGAFLVLEVHDELVYECPAERASEFSLELKAAMETRPHPSFIVPIEAEVGTGPNYEEAKS